MPAEFILLKESYSVSDCDRIVVMVTSIHREKLPSLVGCPQTEVACWLARRFSVQLVDKSVIAEATAIHVVVSSKRENRHCRIVSTKYLVDERSEVVVTFCRGPGVVDIAQVN